MEGPLSKWTNVVQGWQYRWFVIDIMNVELLYYTSKDKMVKKLPRGRFNLKNAAIGVDDVDNSKFTLFCEGDHVGSKTFYFQAMNTLERNTWVNEIEKVINNRASSLSEEDQANESISQIHSDLAEGNRLVTELEGTLNELRKLVSNFDNAAVLVNSLENHLTSLNLVFINLGKKITTNVIATHVEDSQSVEIEFFDCNEDFLEEPDTEHVDEDILYSKENSGGDAGSGESIIKHLIKQVQIGMDLTKITLPTHILERRSFLEMLADFFSHCDLFSNITDEPGPRERMVTVVRAFLSCFHAGRDPEVVKKPYNPILGEIFRSYWNLTDDSSPVHKSGPVPWARAGDMTLLAEQVSHHPPVSAFFAENKKKGFSFEGQIWTKSKFLGLHVVVHMVGTTVIKLEEHDETYTISFPSGYARSILTVPWFELGGKVQLTGSTGYSAQVEFHTKPTYKNTKNQITAQIFAPGESSPFCTVKGAWNGLMTATFGGEPVVFFDAGTTPTVTKVIQRIKNQESNESRRLWYDVTMCLYRGNVVGATGHKHRLEERQRHDKKVREENGVVYKPKYFELIGDVWKYRPVD